MSSNQEITINFNEYVLEDYEISEYPRFNICVYYGDEEIGEYVETEYLQYFSPSDKNVLIDFINNDLEEELKKYDNIELVDIVWEADEDFVETIDTIYIRKK